MTKLTENVFAVEVPEGAVNFTVDMGYLIYKVPNYANWCNDSILSNPIRFMKYVESHKQENDYKTGGVPLPPGNWRVLCTTRTCTPEQAKEITGEKLYPSIALAGMLKGKGLDADKNILLLEKL